MNPFRVGRAERREPACSPRNNRMQERLWASRNLTSQEATDLAEVVEEADLCSKGMQQLEQRHSSDNEVNMMSKKNKLSYEVIKRGK
ncbi:hypothetical protein NDU88_003426 [Pleurodeles waltl]|uniref:Uncharacterized protein n=1 Tax=Pleurodeles waltl TaxID=8319 RepID=A0AAV7SF70_PLEWA|nr:hypothetical protein NDU88_003426 [Pleurodeles waltl]